MLGSPLRSGAGAASISLRVRVTPGEPGGKRPWYVREVSVAPPPPLSALGASTAAVLAANAWCHATRNAARHAVALRADAELSAELARATRRLRALEKRWIPQHEAALAQLDLALDESQREQAARVRWLTRRTDAAGPAPAASARSDQGRAASSRLQSARP